MISSLSPFKPCGVRNFKCILEQGVMSYVVSGGGPDIVLTIQSYYFCRVFWSIVSCFPYRLSVRGIFTFRCVALACRPVAPVVLLTLLPGGQTETPPCFKEIILRGIYTCSRVLWFRKPRRDHASVRFQYCFHCSCVECEFSFMRYSAEQRIFICNTFMKKSSWRKFRRQFPDSPVPDKTTIYRLVKKFNDTGSVQNKKP